MWREVFLALAACWVNICILNRIWQTLIFTLPVRSEERKMGPNRNNLIKSYLMTTLHAIHFQGNASGETLLSLACETHTSDITRCNVTLNPQDQKILCEPQSELVRSRVCCCRLVAKLCPTLRPHGLWHARPPCPSRSPRVCLNSCPLNQWCHPTETVYHRLGLEPMWLGLEPS